MSGMGNYELEIDNDDEVKRWLRRSPDEIDDWLYELVDAAVFHAASRLRALAPGSISQLVGVELPHQPEPGRIEGAAGVEPDYMGPTTPVQGLGSDPADFPFYVEVGSGVHATDPEASHSPIRTIPGTYPMAWEHMGNMVFAWETQGQKPQFYGLRSYEETASWMPARIRLARQEFARDLERVAP